MSDILAATLAVRIKAMMEGFQEEMEKTASGIKGMSDRIEEHKEQIRKAGTMLSVAGAVITGAFTLAVKSSAEFGDSMDEMHERTGVATEKLSALALAVNTSGASMDSLEVAIKRAQKNLFDAANGSKAAQAAFDILGISVRNSDGSLRDAVDVMIDFADKTKNMEDETTKAALAQKLFGRSGTDLLPVFALGGDGIRKLMGDAQKYGMTIDDLTAKQAGEFNDSFDVMKMSIAGVARQFGYVLLPALLPVVQGITNLAGVIVDFIQQHETLAKVIGAVAAALGLLLTAVGGLLLASTGLPMVISLFTKMSTLLAASGPLGLALIGISVAIYEIAKHWDTVSAAMETFYNQIAVPVINALIKDFSLLWESIKAYFTNILNTATTVWNAIATILSPVIDFVMRGFNSIWGVVDTIFGFMWDKASLVIGKMYGAFRWMLDKLGVELPELSSIFGKIKDTGEGAATAVTAKWESFKNEFARHMAESQKVHADTNKAITKKQAEELDLQREDLSNTEAANVDTKKKSADEQTKIEKDTTGKIKVTHEEMIASLRKIYGDFLTDKQLMEIDQLAKSGQNYRDYIALCIQENSAYLDKYSAYLDDQQMQQAETLFAMGLDWKAFVEGIVTEQQQAMLEGYIDVLNKSEQETVLSLYEMGLDWEGYAAGLGAKKTAAKPTDGTFFIMQDVYAKHMDDMQLETYERLKEMGLDWKAYADEIISEQGPWAKMQVRVDQYFNELRVFANDTFQKVGEGFINDILHGKFNEGIDNMKSSFSSAFDQVKEGLISKLSSGMMNWVSSQVTGIGEKLGSALFSGLSGKGGLLDSLGSAIGGLFSGSGGGGSAIAGVGSALVGGGLIGAAIYGISKLFGGDNETEAQYVADAAMVGTGHENNPGGAFEEYAKNEKQSAATFRIMYALWTGRMKEESKQYELARTDIIGRWAKTVNSGQNPTGWPITEENKDDPAIWRQNVLSPSFHTGGVIPGAIGQEKMITALAGEEVLTRKDPRHRDNMGTGFTINITGNNINSNLDMRELGRLAGEEILRKVQMRESLSF